MFTGCIKTTGKLVNRVPTDDHGKLIVVSDLANTVKKGESLAVNGACLTVEEVNRISGEIKFYLLGETLKRTNLGSIEIGSTLNIEQALALGERLDGHLVTGHIDFKSIVLSIGERGKDTIFTIQLPDEYRPFIVEKGSIAVNGISLTVVEAKKDFFSVHIIPYTKIHTNLGKTGKEEYVNVETDLIGKYILKSQTAKVFL